MKVSPKVIMSNKDNVDEFFALFGKNRLHARVYAMSRHVQQYEHLLFEETPTKYQMVDQTTRFNVSTSLRLYKTYIRNSAILVDGKKFWYRNENNTLRPLTMNDCNGWMQTILIERNPWMAFLRDYCFYRPSINTIISKNLCKPSRILKHLYGFNGPKAMKVHNWLRSESYTNKDAIRVLKQVDNLHRASEDFLDRAYPEQRDLIIMAAKLNERVNAEWGAARMEREHDRMSMIIDNILDRGEDSNLKINPVFQSFNNVIGGMITTSKGLIREGRKMHHCVGGYANSVNSGNCAIYHFRDHTAQISRNGSGLVLTQFKGKHNVTPPEEVTNELNMLIRSFNENMPAVPVVPMYQVDLFDDCDAEPIDVERGFGLVGEF